MKIITTKTQSSLRNTKIFFLVELSVLSVLVVKNDVSNYLL